MDNPKLKYCTYQGQFKSNDKVRICCDATGDDVSPEFCKYCQYYSVTYRVKPMEFAEKFFNALNELKFTGG